MDSGKEKCQLIQSWTFSGLVGSFLDLAIAYLLLCVSATAYIASKFLGFFGLCLPCPCNGLFGNPKPINSIQSFLVESPSKSSSAIRFSASNVEDELEGEASCSSATERKERHCVSRYSTPKNEMDAEFCASKEKGITSLRVRSSPRRRRRRKPVDYGVFSSSDASYDLDKAEGSSEPLNYAALDGSEAPKADGLQECFSHDTESSGAVDENKPVENDVFTAEEFMYDEREEDVGSECNDANKIRVLEHALSEEHAVRAALYSELEKERSAAATAADEAMNMILRLQEEKAAVEIEARQYQRIIEAKSTYDAEEMNILKEILLRREHERRFLEKEVEAYLEMFTRKEDSGADTFSNAFDERYEDKMKITVDFARIEELRSGSSSNEEVCVHDDMSASVDDSGKAPLSGLRRSSMSALELKSYNEPSDPQLRKFGSENSTDLTCGNTSNLGLRRRSMSALDNERLKLEAEVVWLREKLKIVQKGKKKLNISVEVKDQEQVQFKLLDDIEGQLQEIRQLFGHGNAAQEAILPPRSSSSKVKSKKRRCGDASSEVPRSS